MSFPVRMREAVRPGAERDKFQRTPGKEGIEGLPAREPLIFAQEEMSLSVQSKRVGIKQGPLKRSGVGAGKRGSTLPRVHTGTREVC